MGNNHKSPKTGWIKPGIHVGRKPASFQINRCLTPEQRAKLIEVGINGDIAQALKPQ